MNKSRITADCGNRANAHQDSNPFFSRMECPEHSLENIVQKLLCQKLQQYETQPLRVIVAPTVSRGTFLIITFLINMEWAM